VVLYHLRVMSNMQLCTLAEAYLHRLDPFVVRFTDDVGIRWYGLSYAVGFVLAWLILRWFAKTGRGPMSVRQVGDVMIPVILGVLLGGRLGYALFYDRGLFIGFTSTLPWWDLLAINKGGMASHGGIIGVMIALWWFARRQAGGLSPLHLFDLAAFAGLPGLFLGRLANFINGELPGKVLPDAMQADPPWWSVKYPADVYGFVNERAVQLGDAVQAMGGSVGEWHNALLQATVNPDAQQTVDYWLAKMVTAMHDGNEVVIDAVQPLLSAYYPSQIFQALTDGPILMGALALIWLRPRKPGLIASWFLVIYGILRVATEVFRQPDEGVSLLWGLSRGQVLSVVMIVLGAVCVWWCAQRKVEPIACLRNPMHAPVVDDATG
jgi:phosphatidylglycerol:prolipoprotein diacylglycerol transferase